jgi:hypothetical protein
MSRTGHPKITGDRTPVTGVDKPPKRALRAIPALNAPAPRDPLSRHILRLLALHGNVLKRFGDINLTAMSPAAKRSLLSQINRVLGISATKSSRSR